MRGEAASSSDPREPAHGSAAVEPKPPIEPGSGHDGSGSGEITGARIVAELCKAEGLGALFCAPGLYSITNAIAELGIHCYGGRTEGSMFSAADGFTRVTGEVAACSAIEGPGFTNLLMNFAAAHFARSPVLALIGSASPLSIDRQERPVPFMDQQSMTRDIRKYGKLVQDPARIVEHTAGAFRSLKSGVPGVAHLDFSWDVTMHRFPDRSQLSDSGSKRQYRSDSRSWPQPQSVRGAVEMVAKAERPLLVAGHGVFMRRGHADLARAAEKNDIAVVGSGPVRGNFPDDHRLSASFSSQTLRRADLVVFVGQYTMPNRGDWGFSPDVKTINVHPVQEELGHGWPIDLGIVSDEALFLEAFADALPSRERSSWTDEIAAARRDWEQEQIVLAATCLNYTRDAGALHPFTMLCEIHDFLYKGSIDPKQTVLVYGGAMTGFCAMTRNRAYRPGQVVPAMYQFGAMGPDIPLALGAAVAVQQGVGPQAPYQGAPVVVALGDGGLAYGLAELETCAKYRLPVVIVVYNNGANAWPMAMGVGQAEHIYRLRDNVRYDKIAEELGARGEIVRTPEELRQALGRSYELGARERLPSLINCVGLKEFNQPELYPPLIGFAPEPGVGSIKY